MKQEDKVCSLEQAKRLVDLGVVLNTETFWFVDKNIRGNGGIVLKQQYFNGPYDPDWDRSLLKWYPAPDTSELGVLLPGQIFDKTSIPIQKTIDYVEEQITGSTYYLSENVWLKKQHKFGVRYLAEDEQGKPSLVVKRGETEAQARCAALIWLLENGYMKPEDCKL